VTKCEKTNDFGGGGDGNPTWDETYPGATYRYNYRSVVYPPNSAVFYPTSGTVIAGCSVTNKMNSGALKSMHPGGVHIILGDASVRMIQDSINMDTFKNLADRRDQLPVGDF
jgi:hypothetical protein